MIGRDRFGLKTDHKHTMIRNSYLSTDVDSVRLTALCETSAFCLAIKGSTAHSPGHYWNIIRNQYIPMMFTLATIRMLVIKKNKKSLSGWWLRSRGWLTNSRSSTVTKLLSEHQVHKIISIIKRFKKDFIVTFVSRTDLLLPPVRKTLRAPFIPLRTNKHTNINPGNGTGFSTTQSCYCWPLISYTCLWLATRHSTFVDNRTKLCLVQDILLQIGCSYRWLLPLHLMVIIC